jgi:hypothetical protein
LHLLGTWPTTWARSPVLFALFIFHLVSHFLPRQALDCDTPTYASLTAEIIGTPHHARLTFCPGWSQTMTVLVSTPQLARITDVGHHMHLQVQQYDWLLGVSHIFKNPNSNSLGTDMLKSK